MAGELGPPHHLLIWTDRLDLFALPARTGITVLSGKVCTYPVVFFFLSMLLLLPFSSAGFFLFLFEPVSYTHVGPMLQTRPKSLVVRA